MQGIHKPLLAAFALLLLASAALAISTDEAIAIVSVQNNYLLPNETASVSNGTINYKGTQYIIVAAQNNASINAYIPINNATGAIATQDIEISELIRTAIIYSQMNQLNQSVSSANWPFSYSTKSYFTDLSNDYGALMNSIITVQTELNKINDPNAKELATTAGAMKTMADDLAAESTKTADSIDKARAFEQGFLSKPDTNQTQQYENYYDGYFTEIATIKDKYSALDAKLTELSQGIGALETPLITIDQKKSFQSLLSTPVNARRLPDFFSQTDQLRTEIEGIFNAAKNSGAFSATLASRKARNEAWLIMYGPNGDLAKLDSSFTNLQSAAEAVLSTENVDAWSNQDAISALKTNWAGAQSRYNTAEYDKAKGFATKALANVKLIIADGANNAAPTDNSLIIDAIIGLVVLVIIIFVLQNFVLKKKAKEEPDEQEYN